MSFCVDWGTTRSRGLTAGASDKPLGTHFSTKKLPITSDPSGTKNVRTASVACARCFAAQIEGLFMISGTPGAFLESHRAAAVKRIELLLDGFAGAALPSTCVTRGNHAALPAGRTCAEDHERRIGHASDNARRFFFHPDGANGRHPLAKLHALFTLASSRDRGPSARSSGLPRARGPKFHAS